MLYLMVRDSVSEQKRHALPTCFAAEALAFVRECGVAASRPRALGLTRFSFAWQAQPAVLRSGGRQPSAVSW